MPITNHPQLLASAHNLLREQHFEEARKVLSTVFDKEPQNAEIAFTLGNVCRQQNDLAAAATYYRKATIIKPDFFAAWCNGGAAFRATKSYEEALSMLEKALQLKPESVEAQANYAFVLTDCKRHLEAVPHLEKALAMRPDAIHLRISLADCYLAAGKIPEATTILLQTNDTTAELLCAQGRCAAAERNFTSAKEHFYRALKINPAYGDAHFLLGNIMREWNHLDEALLCYKTALRLQPNRVDILVNYGEALQITGEIEESIRYFKKALSIDSKSRIAAHNLLVSLNYSTDHSAGEIREAHTAWGTTVTASEAYAPHHDRDPDRPLRIGYLSPDFCNHPAASFLEPMLRFCDHDAFEVFCYMQTVHSDERTTVFRSLTDHWNTVEHLSDDALYTLIVNDAIDILIDTAGHFGGNRLEVLARRPAPLQISGIGYPGSTGLPAIRYRITDAIIDPLDDAHQHPYEQLIVLDQSFCCYTPPSALPTVNTPAPRPLTFGSLHTTARLNSTTIALWSRVLSAIPESRLIICRNTLSPSIIQRLSGWLEEHNIALSRIQFISTIGTAGHFVTYHDIDITLDTLPWSGHTTACESLMMGVPVITLIGNRPAGRMVSSVLTAATLRDWIASTPEAYVQIACNYTADRNMLASLRSTLRERVLASPLCNGLPYMQELEKKYRLLWHEWCTAQ